MILIDKERLPQVALGFANDDHAEAAELANRLDWLLSKALAGESVEAEIDTALDQFQQHNVEHFAREEEQMQRVGFFAYDCHKGEHERVLAWFNELVAQWHEDRDAEVLAKILREDIREWLLNHIATMDTVTAQFVAMHDAR